VVHFATNHAYSDHRIALQQTPRCAARPFPGNPERHQKGSNGARPGTSSPSWSLI